MMNTFICVVKLNSLRVLFDPVLGSILYHVCVCVCVCVCVYFQSCVDGVQYAMTTGNYEKVYTAERDMW